MMAARALAELGKADVPALAQFQPGGDHHAVNIHAGLPLELEQHAHRAGIVGAAAQHPAAAAENCAGERLHQRAAPRWRRPSSASPRECSSLAPRSWSGIVSLTPLLSEPGRQHNECCGVERHLTGLEHPAFAGGPGYSSLRW
jgi:hypothetical protein